MAGVSNSGEGHRECTEPDRDPDERGLEHLADVAEVAEGELLPVTNAAGEQLCLFNLKGTIGAVANVCTHAAFPMSDGTLRRDGVIECAWHGAQFDCRSGAVRRGPAVDALPVYEVRVEGNRVLVGRRPR